jgi:hypothetical protein
VLYFATLEASNPTYAEPVLAQVLPTWAGCHVRVLVKSHGNEMLEPLMARFGNSSEGFASSVRSSAAIEGMAQGVGSSHEPVSLGLARSKSLISLAKRRTASVPSATILAIGIRHEGDSRREAKREGAEVQPG